MLSAKSLTRWIRIGCLVTDGIDTAIQRRFSCDTDDKRVMHTEPTL